MFGETTTNEENHDRQKGLGLQTSALNQKAVSLARAPLAQISSFNEKVSDLFQKHRIGVNSNGDDTIRVKKGQQYQMVFNLLGRSDDFIYFVPGRADEATQAANALVGFGLNRVLHDGCPGFYRVAELAASLAP